MKTIKEVIEELILHTNGIDARDRYLNKALTDIRALFPTKTDIKAIFAEGYIEKWDNEQYATAILAEILNKLEG